MDPPKPTINETPNWKRCLSLRKINLPANGFSWSRLSPSLTEHDYCIRFLPEKRGWCICVYSNKQCQCSGLWQTLNWIAFVMNKSLLRHLFLNEAGRINTKCCSNFISIAKVWLNSASPRNSCFLYPFLYMWGIYQFKHWNKKANGLYPHTVITSTVYAVLIHSEYDK